MQCMLSENGHKAKMGEHLYSSKVLGRTRERKLIIKIKKPVPHTNNSYGKPKMEAYNGNGCVRSRGLYCAVKTLR